MVSFHLVISLCILTTFCRCEDSNVFASFSKDKLSKILKILKSNDNKQTECLKDFDFVPNSIIRPKDSLKNGATFLKNLEQVKSSTDCGKLCCEFVDEKYSLGTCDMALYQKNLAVCYLFKCFNDVTKTNSCVFSNKTGYTVFKRKSFNNALQSIENEVHETNKSTTVTTTSATTTTSTTTISTTTTSTTATTTKVEAKKDNISPMILNDSSLIVSKSTSAKKISSTSAYTTNSPIVIHQNVTEVIIEYINMPDEADSVMLPLILGLVITFLILVMVVCRVQVMKKKIGRGNYMKMQMDESDYLINGMYL